jgi:uncharacterized low-complexity protein
MCGQGSCCGHHGHAPWRQCGPGVCGPGFPFGPRFSSREERIAQLEEYLKDLQAQAKAVEGRLAELKAAG